MRLNASSQLNGTDSPEKLINSKEIHCDISRRKNTLLVTLKVHSRRVNALCLHSGGVCWTVWPREQAWRHTSGSEWENQPVTGGDGS